jgi:hypothetical protein
MLLAERVMWLSDLILSSGSVKTWLAKKFVWILLSESLKMSPTKRVDLIVS